MPSYNHDYHTPASTGLTLAQTAQARQHSYTLFSQLFLKGLTTADLSAVGAVPELEKHLPAAFDPDEAAAVHYKIFGFEVFPYESFFLGESGLLGGDATREVQQSYQRLGYFPKATAGILDHFGQELAALAYLCQAEAEAMSQNRPEVVALIRQRQQIFLEQHLLRWLAPLSLAVQSQANDFYTAVTDLSQSVLHDHFHQLCAQNEERPRAAPWQLPTPPDLLAEEKTGLKDIAGYLIIPVYSGIFLSRQDIARLARDQKLPRGFGDRQQMLVNLLRTAAQYDAFPALLMGLQDTMTRWHIAYGAQKEKRPAFMPFIERWQERTAQTMQLLSQFQAKAI